LFFGFDPFFYKKEKRGIKLEPLMLPVSSILTPKISLFPVKKLFVSLNFRMQAETGQVIATLSVWFCFIKSFHYISKQFLLHRFALVLHSRVQYFTGGGTCQNQLHFSCLYSHYLVIMQVANAFATVSVELPLLSTGASEISVPADLK
jgi:hypothetical protein